MDNSNVGPSKLFKILGLSIAYLHTTAAPATDPVDREILRNNGYIHFKVIDKDILYLPLADVPEANPLTAISTTATSSTIAGYAVVGGPMYRFPIPITLEPYQNFTFDITFSSATITTTCDIIVTLHAYMRRPT